MICKHCGKILNDYDRFCSNCGTRTEFEQDENFVFTAPERDFEWDVHSFPDNRARKTEDAVFDWGIEEGEFRSWPAQASGPQRTKLTTPRIDPVPGSVEAMQQAASAQEKPAAEEVPAPETKEVPAPEKSVAVAEETPAPEMAATQQASAPEITEAEEASAQEKPVTEKEPVQETPAVEESQISQTEIQDLQLFGETSADEAGSGKEEQETNRTISNVNLEPVADAEQKVREEQKPKKKRGFFARFSKDKDTTLEQPVITDEQIQQARDEARKKTEDTAEQAAEPIAAHEESAADELSDTEMMFASEESAKDKLASDETEDEDISETQHIEFDWSQPVGETEEKTEEKTEDATESKSGQSSDLKWAMAMDPREDFLAMQERQSQPSAEKATEESGTNELKEEYEDDITGKELEQELFGGAAVTGVVDGGEGLSRQSAKIDQFYTFNKRNEEFQKLLDKEYEKFREGRPLDDDIFNANVEAIKAGVTDSGTIQKGDTAGIRQMEEINEAIMNSPMAERKTMPYRVIDEKSDEILLDENKDTKAEKSFAGGEYDGSGFIKVEAPSAEEESFDLPDEKTEAPVDLPDEKTEAPVDLQGMIFEEPLKEDIQESSIPESEDVPEENIPEAEDAPEVQIPESEDTPEVQIPAAEDDYEYTREEQENIEKIREIFGMADENSAPGDAGGFAAPAAEYIGSAEGSQPAAEEDEDIKSKNDGKDEKGGTAGKVAIVILSIILALLLLALGIKLFAPDSSFAHKIDDAADTVITFFTGDKQQPQEEKADANEFNADLNAVIQTALDQNYNGYIEEIAYDPNLGYEKKTENIRIRS